MWIWYCNFSKRHRSQKLFVRFSSDFPQVLNWYETTQSMIFVDFSRGIFEKMEAKNHLIRWFSYYLRRGIVQNHGFQVDGSGKMTRRYFWKFRKVLSKHRHQVFTILNVIWPTVFQKKHSTNYGITLCTFDCVSRVVDLPTHASFPETVWVDRAGPGPLEGVEWCHRDQSRTQLPPWQ